MLYKLGQQVIFLRTALFWIDQSMAFYPLLGPSLSLSLILLHGWSLQKEFTPVKYFSIDRVFRNETLDNTHLAEFNQIEGVVADRNLTLGHLMGILREFFHKLGMLERILHELVVSSDRMTEVFLSEQTTVKEEIFVGEKFRTFPSKTFRMEFNFVLSNWPKKVKTRSGDRKACKPGAWKKIWYGN